MWQFLQSLFFGGLFLITPAPVSITGSWQQIPLKAPLEVLNSGAALEIDVTSVIPPTKPGGHDVTERFNSIDKHFPQGCVEARLIAKGGTVISVSNVAAGVTSTHTHLLLSGTNGMPLSHKFSKLLIRASCPMSSVTIYWRNSGK